MRDLQVDEKWEEKMGLLIFFQLLNRLFGRPDEDEVLRELDKIQWVPCVPWVIARDLGCSTRKTKAVLDALASRSLVRHLGYYTDDDDWIDEYMITRAGMAKIDSTPKPNPAALPGNEFVHVLT